MKRTLQRNKSKRNKTHGFLVRSKSKNGKLVLKNRRRKNRKSLTV